LTVALKSSANGTVPTALLATDYALDDEVALAGCSACDQQIDARCNRGGVGAGQGNFLSDDWSQVAVEGKEELLDVETLRIVLKTNRVADGVVEHGCLKETDHRIHAAVV
jgi:hypothetical protein